MNTDCRVADPRLAIAGQYLGSAKNAGNRFDSCCRRKSAMMACKSLDSLGCRLPAAPRKRERIFSSLSSLGSSIGISISQSCTAPASRFPGFAGRFSGLGFRVPRGTPPGEVSEHVLGYSPIPSHPAANSTAWYWRCDRNSSPSRPTHSRSTAPSTNPTAAPPPGACCCSATRGLADRPSRTAANPPILLPNPAQQRAGETGGNDGSDAIWRRTRGASAPRVPCRG